MVFFRVRIFLVPDPPLLPSPLVIVEKNNIGVRASSSEHRKTVLIWCGGACALLSILWGGVLLEISRDRAAWHASTLAKVRDLAEKYGDHVQRALEQVDQLSVLLISAKESAADNDLLEKQIRLVAEHASMFAFYADEAGIVRNAFHQSQLDRNLSKEAFFTVHRDSTSRELIVHPRDFGVVLAGQLVVRFTRRVEKPDGRFDGLLAVSVPLTFFNGLKTPDALSKGDFASVWFEKGLPLMTQGEARQADLPAGYRAMPHFQEKSGARLEPGSLFVDKGEHYVGWKTLADYPLKVVVAMRQDNAMVFASETEESHLLTGLLCTIVLLGGCTVGARMQLAYDARRRHKHEMQNTFRLAVDGAREAFYMLTPALADGGESGLFCIEECNQHAARIAASTPDEMLGKTFTEIFSRIDAASLKSLLQKAIQEGFSEAEIASPTEEGDGDRWQHFSAVRLHAGISVTVRDISDLKGKEQQLKTMALTDALTLLPNRHWLKQQLATALETAQRSGAKLALLFIDLDNFKKINDSQGHQAGDEYLVAVAAALQSAVRKEDHVVRLGGDEFTVLMERVSGHDIADKIAGQILGRLQGLDCPAVRNGFAPSASVGVAVFPDDAMDAVSLMQAADIAMYAAKAAGKGQFAVYSVALAGQVQNRLQLEQGLQLALMRDELRLYFQPRACARTGKPLCLEALLRWQHPVRGLIAPGEFIALAEESDLILQIGDWVAEEICAQLARWRKEGCVVVPVSMNISARQLKSDQFRRKLAASMSAHGVAPAFIAIELTESTMLGDEGTTQAELAELRNMGIELHIDDFGTGYSSFSQLQRLDVDTIKIDSSFVQAIGVQEKGRMLCEAMIQIGQTLGFRVVAEGVETQTQLRELQLMRCDEIQGYLVSEPVPAGLVPDLLNRANFFGPVFPVVQRVVSGYTRGPTSRGSR